MKPLALLLALFTPVCLMADNSRYSGEHTVTADNGTMKVVHMHNWNSEKIPVLFRDLAHHDAFLGPKNDFSSIEVIDPSGSRHYRRPSSALSLLWISPDSKFIVGLSNVMLQNPYQVMVWRSDGTLLYKEHISPVAARLTPKEFEDFCQQHPAARAIFKDRSQLRDGHIYLDYDITGVGIAVGDDGWQYLFAHQVKNPYSDAFTSTVTNYVYWFDAQAPGLAIKENGDRVELSLNSPTGKPMHLEFAAK